MLGQSNNTSLRRSLSQIERQRSMNLLDLSVVQKVVMDPKSDRIFSESEADGEALRKFIKEIEHTEWCNLVHTMYAAVRTKPPTRNHGALRTIKAYGTP